MKTKNLFSFATRELSQDAFLRWLLENYNSDEEDVKKASQFVIKNFLDLSQNSSIVDVRTYAQLGHTDICAKVKVSNGTNYVIVLEDKVESGAGNPFETYVNKIEKFFKGYSIQKFVYAFYKTGYITQDDRDKLEKAKQGLTGRDWRIYGLPEIIRLFDAATSAIECRNAILRDYIEDIKNQSELENCSLKEWRKSTFVSVLGGILSELEKKFPQIDAQNETSSGIWNGRYAFLWIRFRSDFYPNLVKLYDESSGLEKTYKLKIIVEFQFRWWHDGNVYLYPTVKIHGQSNEKNDKGKFKYACIDTYSEFSEKLKAVVSDSKLLKFGKNQRNFWNKKADKLISDLTKEELLDLLAQYLIEIDRMLKKI